MNGKCKTPSCTPKQECKRAYVTRYHLWFADLNRKRRPALADNQHCPPTLTVRIRSGLLGMRSAGQLWDGIHRTLPLPFHQPEALFGKGMTRPRCPISAFDVLHFIPAFRTSQARICHPNAGKTNENRSNPLFVKVFGDCSFVVLA